jgi:hypothetical protein
MQKARGQAFQTEVRHSPPTACKHTVSGTLSLPSQGCFSPRRFPRDFTCPAVLRYLSSEPANCRLPGCHRLWQAFPGLSTRSLVSYSPALRPDRPYNPAVHARRFGLFRVRSPLLAESLTCFLFLEVLRWFTSLRCPPQPMDSAEDLPVLPGRGFPIRTPPGQSLFAAHRGLSQLTASFIDF